MLCFGMLSDRGVCWNNSTSKQQMMGQGILSIFQILKSPREIFTIVYTSYSSYIKWFYYQDLSITYSSHQVIFSTRLLKSMLSTDIVSFKRLHKRNNILQCKNVVQKLPTSIVGCYYYWEKHYIQIITYTYVHVCI